MFRCAAYALRFRRAVEIECWRRLAVLDPLSELCYRIDRTIPVDSPAYLGVEIAQRAIDLGQLDGSDEGNGYVDPTFQPDRDLVEHAEYFDVSDGPDWLITYYDSPSTLRPKLGLARDNGLAGAGFWAMGYDRGVPGYLELMSAFRAGNVARSEAPPRPSPAP